MRLLVPTLFLASAFQLALSILSDSRLTCYTCVNISIPDIRNKYIMEKTNVEPLNDPCWLFSGSTPHQRRCDNPHEVCTAALFSGGAQRILVRTCLNHTMPDVFTDCGFFSATNHSKSAHKFFEGFFDKTDFIYTKICTCTADNCDPSNIKTQRTKYIIYADPQSLTAQNMIYNKFLEIIRSNTTYKILWEQLAGRLPTTIESVNPSDFGESDQKEANTIDNENTPVLEDASNFIPADKFPPGPFETPETVTEGTDNTNIPNSSTATNSFNSQNITAVNSTSDNIQDNNSSSILAKSGSFISSQTISTLKYIIVPIVVSTLMLALVVSILILRRRYRPNRQIRDHLKQHFKNKTNVSTNNLDEVLKGYDKAAFEISMDAFKIDESKILYTGEYEKAYYARITRGKNKSKATAKIPKPSSSGNSLTAVCKMAQEIKMLIFIGSHEHIVYFVGAYTEGAKSGRVYLFHEICSLGPLEIFLSYLEIDTRYSFVESDILMDLNKWERQIAEGMEFIASKDVVHADLCSKNVLLDSQKTAKIANFGYARRVEQPDFVKLLKPINWQWQPPESLTRLEFTEKSDVWAFGVLLWELYTLGDQPYSNLAYPSNFSTQLERGYRLERPVYANDEIYKLMLQCWSTEPEQRPGFSGILKTLTDFNCFKSNIASFHI